MAKPHQPIVAVRLAAACCALCAALLAVGCRNLDNAQVDVLERELRAQEDYIYELEGHIYEYSEKLRQARLAHCPPATKAKGSDAKSAARPEAGEPTLDLAPPAAPLPAPTSSGARQPQSAAAPRPAANDTLATPAPESPAPSTEASPAGGTAEPAQPAAPESTPTPEPVDPAEMDVPELEIGPGVNAAPTDRARSLAAAPTLIAPRGADDTLVIPDPIDFQAEETPTESATLAAVVPESVAQPALSEPELMAPEVDAPRLTAERLEIRRVFGEPASEEDSSLAKLLVVVEALSSSNEPVGAEGEVSMMIMVRDAPNSFQRIDRWDFTPQETAAAWQSSQFGDGLHLELPLHAPTLPEGDLELWARVVTPDGRKLLAQIPLAPAQLAAMDDALEPAALAAVDPPDSVPADSAGVAPLTQPASHVEVAVRPKPQWRAATTRIDAAPEGDGAPAASAQSSDAWDAAQPSVNKGAPSASAGSGTKSQWKRSTAAAASQAPPAWGPDR